MTRKFLNPRGINLIFCLTVALILLSACGTDKSKTKNISMIPIILDTDANNELDDQHAIAYMLFNSDFFDIKGITVNDTYNGGGILGHVEEAERVVKLCNFSNKVKIIPGASGNYYQIKGDLDNVDFDGHEAVNFIIDEARKIEGQKLVLVPIGKLTNITLALEKAPDIAKKVKVVWLGSNWPEPGEYNLINDTSSLAPLLKNKDLEFEILTVRYGKPSGTDAVSLSVEEVRATMTGLGPKVDPLPGRHGGSFNCFGDYSVELYKKYGEAIRPIFDVCALVILKYPEYGKKTAVKGVSFDGMFWAQVGNEEREIVFWEDFDKDAIIKEFYNTMKKSEELYK
jgi:inosine-uridine nucleoside N-ribohydrolase